MYFVNWVNYLITLKWAYSLKKTYPILSFLNISYSAAFWNKLIKTNLFTERQCEQPCLTSYWMTLLASKQKSELSPSLPPTFSPLPHFFFSLQYVLCVNKFVSYSDKGVDALSRENHISSRDLANTSKFVLFFCALFLFVSEINVFSSIEYPDLF